MNELLSLAGLTLQKLSAAVVNVLKTELREHGMVTEVENQVLIHISRTDFEHRLGNLLQQIYKTVDQHFPAREDYLSIVIRDMEEKYENTFKIWPTK